MDKLVYFFAPGQTDGADKGKAILGGKGEGLAKMTVMGLPVPPGFTIATTMCQYFYDNNLTYHPELESEVQKSLDKLETITGKQFGRGDNPLLVSVRSGAADSMPGMMDTILNLGLNDVTVESLSRKTSNPRFAYDAYRRFIQMFSGVVENANDKEFEEVLTKHKKKLGVENDSDLPLESLKEIVNEFKAIYKNHTKQDFPQDVNEQLWKAIKAVFLSWNTDRAVAYRKINHIHGLLGTAVNICTMVFGNMGEDSGTGVAFTRNPSTGEKEVFGEFLPNAQGEDIVAGIRTPYKISELKTRNEALYNQFIETCSILEKHYKDMQDIEFTIEQGKLYLLQTRSGKRTGQASLKVAVDLYEEGLITKEEALLLVNADQVAHSLIPIIDPSCKNYEVITTGVKASFGVAIGKVIFDPYKLEKIEDNESYILLCQETSPEYLMAMYKAKGIITSKGGATSHAAVVTRAMGKPCVVGCHEIFIDEHNAVATVGNITIKEGDIVSINGTDGEVIKGAVPVIQPKLDSKEIKTVIAWANEIRKMRVHVNADTPAECEKALELGAEGVGLARTEHMFFDKERILFMREMIFAPNEEERKKALEKLLPFQKKDFLEMFDVMQDKPVTVRLLDPPLHEFMPREKAEQEILAKHMGITLDDIHKKMVALKEENPMLGLRGCRLGLVYPEITIMQIRAIIQAGCDHKKKHGISPNIEIMVPLTGTIGEMKISKQIIEKTIAEILKANNTELNYKIGTMIEIPRATIIADQIAQETDFFSFGTNDLTQMTFGYSRDDAHVFIEMYQEMKILPYNPFVQVDEEGVGALIKMACERGRQGNPKLKIGVCGEHGGNPSSIYFFKKAGVDYVSCSTYRVPTAIVAAAQAELLNR